jgi:hypothetical protein
MRNNARVFAEVDVDDETGGVCEEKREIGVDGRATGDRFSLLPPPRQPTPWTLRKSFRHFRTSSNSCRLVSN